MNFSHFKMAYGVCESNKLSGLEAWKLREADVDLDVQGK